MNITTAAHYMSLGYRIRRQCWEPEEYLSELCGLVDRVEVSYYGHTDENGIDTDVREIGQASSAFFQLEDLLADDWEIVLEGIRKPFNKYDRLEYEDDIDHDNYNSKSDYFD